MRKIIALVMCFLYISIPVYADYSVKIVPTNALEKEVNRGRIFEFFSKSILATLPKSYNYIQLNFTDIQPSDEYYKYVQKMVYSDLIENKKIKLSLGAGLNAFVFYSLVEKMIGYDVVSEVNASALQSRNTKVSDLIFVNNLMAQLSQGQKGIQDIFGETKSEIFSDVYQTIMDEHYESQKMKNEDLIYGALEGLAKGSGDKFTTFFPPSDSKDFEESLSGEFEGIGAYIDMEKPGELRVISPLAGSPAEKAGIKGGDIIYKINGVQIDKSMTAKQAVTLIKGPAGTKVVLDILRGDEKIQVEIIRAKVIINDVDYKLLNHDTFYIQMKSFGDKIFDQTSQALSELKKQSGVKTLIFDLRNNPGGYLDQAVNVLSLFVDKSKPVAVVKYKNGDVAYDSYGFSGVALGNYKVYILANSGSASASEIFIGTMKDYFPQIQIIGEKTYGKGSVQTIKYYTDGSSFKYTIAKWFTGKTQTGIDGVGIYPDKEIILDVEKFKTGVDNQLDYILNILQ